MPETVRIEQIDFDPNGVYIVTTPFAKGSDDIRELCLSINRALRSQGVPDVPVVVLPAGASLQAMTDDELRAMGLFRKRRPC